MPISPEQLPNDPQALKEIIAAMAQDAIAAQAEIARLRFQLARYRRAEYGQSSEKLAREVEQLELAIETLEADQAERLAAASPVVAAAIEAASEAQKPARRPLPEHLPRQDVTHPVPCVCPACGGALRRIGEDITETLDYVPGRFKVIRHVRAKLSCRTCDSEHKYKHNKGSREMTNKEAFDKVMASVLGARGERPTEANPKRRKKS